MENGIIIRCIHRLINRYKIDRQILTKSSLQRFHEPDDKTCPLRDMLQHVGNLNKDISDFLTCAKRLIAIDMKNLQDLLVEKFGHYEIGIHDLKNPMKEPKIFEPKNKTTWLKNFGYSCNLQSFSPLYPKKLN